MKTEQDMTTEHMAATLREIAEAIARQDWAAVKMLAVDLGLLADKQVLSEGRTPPAPSAAKTQPRGRFWSGHNESSPHRR